MTVAVVMGSDSDLPVMRGATEMLERFGVRCITRVVSAHRDPLGMVAFGSTAHEDDIEVIIAGAGGAAHLPGMLASLTTLPVIGVPIGRPRLDGLDSLLSIVQMPEGIPVATVAIDAAANAALLALRILALSRPELRAALAHHRSGLAAGVVDRNRRVQEALNGPS